MKLLTAEQRTFVRRWIDDLIHREGYRQHDDLHVNAVAPGIATAQWFDVAVETFEIAVDHVKGAFPRFKVTMDFCLRSDVHPLGANFTSREELEREFTRQPPSLHILPLQSAGSGHAVTLAASRSVFGLDWAMVKYIERMTEGDGYTRFVWLEWPGEEETVSVAAG